MRDGVTITADALGDQTMIHAEVRRSVEMPIVVLAVASIATVMMGLVALAGLEWTLGLATLLLMLLVGGGYIHSRDGRRRQLAETEAHMQTALNQCAALMLESPAPVASEADTASFDAGLLVDEELAPAGVQPQVRRMRS